MSDFTIRAQDCDWELDKTDWPGYMPGCGEVEFSIISPAGIKFCPWCGGRINVLEYDHEA